MSRPRRFDDVDVQGSRRVKKSTSAEKAERQRRIKIMVIQRERGKSLWPADDGRRSDDEETGQ